MSHPAGTSKESDKCDLSKDSEIAPLTLGSMENTTYFISHRKPILVKIWGKYICLTSLTRAKCGTHSTLCWKILNISDSTELFAL